MDGELEGGPYPEPEPAHVAMWHFARELMPEATVEAMDTFVIFTDGRQNILGAVSPTSSDHSTWSLELDIVDSRYRQEFLHTVVHEISHLLSLEPGQIEDVSPNGQAECGEQLNLVDSCARADSYLQAWGDAFWPDGQPGGSEEFVTDYAMASPEEDFAEHFVEFVLNDPPTGSSVIDEKVQFFYDYDELVEVRGLMRDELDL
ncbi:MAG: hypothetical protein EDR02_06985 [Actinobacteria bacterium]|nr:MAG: hypothetical protein EDR02_06985 [Actinomycetota bacterium]RIK07301.1 MAG: hypothetical protein DCC48_04265 [Acidobacteriota bacterium]